MLAATFFFSLMNVCIKKISHIPAMETTFFRCLVSMSFCFAIIAKDKLDWRYLALGLFSAFCSGIAYNLVRSLKAKEHPIVIVLHFQLVGTIIGFVGCFLDWKMPQGMDWVYLLLTGILTQLGQTNLTKSLQSERIAITTSLNYLGILYALIFGVFFFSESYTTSIITGIVLVVTGVLLNVIFGKKEKVIIAEDE